MTHYKLTKEEQQQADDDFRAYCDDFFNTGNEDSWQKMFDLVIKASESAVKTKLKNVKVDDDRLNDIILDTASAVMKSLRKKKDNGQIFILKNKLVTLCAPYTLWPLYNKQQQFEDRALSLDSYVEDNGEGCLGSYESN